MKKFHLLAILASLALLFGCSDDSSDYKNKSVSPGTTQATLVEMTVPDVDLGDSGNICIHFEPKDAEVWVYCDTDLADFDGDAIKVQEDDKGKWCTVPFKTNGAGSFTFYVRSVKEEWSENVVINPVINSLEIKGSKKELDKDETLNLSASANPSVAASAITWKSSNPDIATVDSNGLVTAKKSGLVTITASTKKKPNSESDSTQVSATFDVVVKGFYLNDTAYYLYTEPTGGEEDEETARATATGYSGYTIEWTSSDENLFTVVGGTDNTAKLKYKDGASGKGRLTATLKQSGKEDISITADVYVLRYEMVALGDSIAAGYAAPAMGGQYGHDEDLLEQDFLDAYNKYLKRRAEGSDNFDYVNEFAHSAIIKKDYEEKYNIRLRSYAKSGDQTSHLIEKLAEDFEDAALGTRKGEIYKAVNEANIITLCIGANDILHHALGINIVLKSVEEFDKLFADSFESFKGNFDTILQKLTGNNQQVLVMSIYNPYYYFDNEHLTDDQINSEALFGFVKTKKILEILPLAQNYLNRMNAYIKEKADANSNVYFVDVATEFNSTAAEIHHTYVNVDPSKFSLEGLVSTFGKTIPIWFDPHPRKLGQERIAKLFEGMMD